MLRRLRVVLLAVDARALAVFLLLDAPLLFRADVAVGAGAGFGARVARLAGLELRRLARGERAGLRALLDARLLVDVALDVGLHALRRSGVRIARLRIVLLAVDIAAHPVLLARETRLLGGTELAVAHRARLVLLDLRLLPLEPCGFTSVEAARLQALLDALLLVDVALDGARLRERCAAEGKRQSGGDGGVCEFHGDSLIER